MYKTDFDYVQILTSERNNVTGIRSIQRTLLHLPAILLPQNQARKFIQDIGYLAANKNFTYGALNDFNTLLLIIMVEDLPRNFQVDLNGFIIHEHKRYEKASFIKLLDVAHILTAKGVEGAYPFATIEQSVTSTLQFQQGVINELN